MLIKDVIAVITNKDIQYKRLKHVESNNNSTKVMKVRICPRKFLNVVGTYREWKQPGGPDALGTEGIKNQINRVSEVS